MIMIYALLYKFIANTQNNNSGTSLYQIGTPPTRLNSNTVTFRDSNEQWSANMNTSDDSTRYNTVHDDVGLAEFFARPISIYSTTLTPGAVFAGASINPWQLFISNNRVSNRLSNYRLFSGNLCIKVMINGNSFYYGRYMVSYAPYYLRDAAFAAAAFSTQSSVMQNSQRLKIFVDPSESQAGQLCLPFLWHADMVDLPAGEYLELGALTIEELATLKHANGAVSPITMTFFAWMENVKLSAPTAQDISGITPQAGDEYGSSIVSETASAVAKATGSLSGAPMIGPYMKATSMAAGAMSSVAKMFGYSRPVNLQDTINMKQRPIGELAATDVTDASVKLTVDSKQELSIDPSIVGLGGNDEMALKHIASVESLATAFFWTTAATADTLLFNTKVTPSYAIVQTGPLGTLRTIPACTYASLPFKYWRGTMRYRFMVVGSGFHKGRLKFVWDPIYQNAVGETNIQYTKIVDIGSERDFVIDCAWGNPRGWLVTVPPASLTASTIMKTSRFTSALDVNGVLSVSVLNELTTPNSSINNDITILVFMSMCDDAEFAAPNNVIETLSPSDPSVQTQSGIEITPQSDVETGQLPDVNMPEATENSEEFVPCNPQVDNSLVVYMGESSNSLRQLIKRYAIDYHYSNIAPGIYSHITSDFPMKFGYTFNGIRGTSPNKFDVCNTTMLRYCAMAYLFYRGGTRRKYVFSSNTTTPQFGTMSIQRNTNYGGSFVPTTTALTITTATTISDGMRAATPSGTPGVAVTTLRQNPVIEAEIPFYKDVRFALCRRLNSYSVAPSQYSIPFVEDLTHTFNCNVWTPATANVFTSFVAGAEDSTFMCFQGCMPFYISPTLV